MTCVFQIGAQGLLQNVHRYIWKYEQVDGVLWVVKTLRLHISKTIYLINMIFIEVM